MTMTATSSPDQKPATAAGSWIPWVFVGLFLLVLAVNGTMITIAVSTFNGLETTKAYEKGLTYNDRLAAAAEQERLGWDAALDALPDDGGKVVLIFDLKDKAGDPVAAADVYARLDRPLRAGFDQTITFDEIKTGRYEASVDLPLKGQWDIALTADARGHRYQLTERIHIAP